MGDGPRTATSCCLGECVTRLRCDVICVLVSNYPPYFTIKEFSLLALSFLPRSLGSHFSHLSARFNICLSQELSLTFSYWDGLGPALCTLALVMVVPGFHGSKHKQCAVSVLLSLGFVCPYPTAINLESHRSLVMHVPGSEVSLVPEFVVFKVQLTTYY